MGLRQSGYTGWVDYVRRNDGRPTAHKNNGRRCPVAGQAKRERGNEMGWKEDLAGRLLRDPEIQDAVARGKRADELVAESQARVSAAQGDAMRRQLDAAVGRGDEEAARRLALELAAVDTDLEGFGHPR